MASPKYLETCGACGSTDLYYAFPSNVLYCSRCGCRADSKPARNLQPDDADLDPRRKPLPPARSDKKAKAAKSS